MTYQNIRNFTCCCHLIVLVFLATTHYGQGLDTDNSSYVWECSEQTLQRLVYRPTCTSKYCSIGDSLAFDGNISTSYMGGILSVTLNDCYSVLCSADPIAGRDSAVGTHAHHRSRRSEFGVGRNRCGSIVFTYRSVHNFSWW